MVSLSAALVWWAVSRRPEIAANAAALKEMRVAVLMGLLSAGFFLVSIGVALFSTTAAMCLWLLFFLANRVAGSIEVRRKAQ
jgi:hypothetical protein